MKQPHSRGQGFTLLELMIAAPIAMALMLMINMVFIKGMGMFVRNTATNVAHQEARTATARLLRDIHAAVSIPQLVNAQRQNVETQPLDASGKPTGTAGISIQTVAGGPFNLKNDPGNKNMIQFYMPGFKPIVGERLILPHYDVEDDITKVTSTGANHFNIWTASGQEERIKEKKGSYIISYVTRRSTYLVANGELRYYPEALGAYVVVARYVTSPTPFTIPLTSTGTPDNRYVGVKLVTSDPRYSNRKLRSVNTMIDTAVPFRAQLTKYQ